MPGAVCKAAICTSQAIGLIEMLTDDLIKDYDYVMSIYLKNYSPGKIQDIIDKSESMIKELTALHYKLKEK